MDAAVLPRLVLLENSQGMSEKEDTWYRRRGYIHFDPPVGYRKAVKLASNPKDVAKHSFWPLIDYEIVTPKVSKKSGKVERIEKSRPIAYAAHTDSHIYSYYAQKLSVQYEERIKKLGIGNHVLAFRRLGKSNINFAHEAFSAIEDFGPCAVVGVDISGFFDNLDHSILKTQLAGLLTEKRLPSDYYAIYRSLTKYAKVSRDELYEKLGISKHNPKRDKNRICSPTQFHNIVRRGGLIRVNKESRGIPQGTPISALLSNIYMLDFDKRMSEMVGEWGGHYYRYCDDMLFIVPQEFRNDVAGAVNEEIKNIKLKINPTKTEIRIFAHSCDGKQLYSDKPVQYLGFLFDGHKVLIRSAALARYSERMKRGVRLAKKSRKKSNELKKQKGQNSRELYKSKIYERYSHLGQRNFIRYGLRAAQIMQSKAIKRQLKPLWKNLQKELKRRDS